MSKKQLTVADFFCGAGGFSEGFRQKGFNVVFALDNWQPAVLTHKLNHPKCNTIKLDVLDLDTPEKIDHYVPDVDVIIGGPPCVSFSGSNKAGKADKTIGLLLIESFLRIIAWKLKKGNLKYWILENVPNAGKYIKNEYTWDELSLPGKGPNLIVEQKVILNAAEFSAPQSRKRFFWGRFPLPEESMKKFTDFNALKNVLNSLTNPLNKDIISKIKDPNYVINIQSDDLTDHFYDTRIAEFEWKKAKRLKEDHGYMGKMSFPEDINRPSRTVMATRSASTRESMILSALNGKGKEIGYRLPTIREIASLMSFPITYQFEAQGESSKYRLVGNAVCSKLSAALAEAICKKEKQNIPKPYFPIIKSKYDLTGTKRKIKIQKNRKFDAKYARHIPYLKLRSFRVDLTNYDSDFSEGKIKWTCILHQGSGKKATKCNSSECKIEEIVNDISDFEKFKNDIKNTFNNYKLSHLQLQKAYVYVQNKNISPDYALEIMRDLIRKNFNEDNSLVTNKDRLIKIERDFIPLRIIAGLYICDYFVRNLI